MVELRVREFQLPTNVSKRHSRSYFEGSFVVTSTRTAYVKDGYTLVTLPRIVTPYRDSVDGTRDRVTYLKLVTR